MFKKIKKILLPAVLILLAFFIMTYLSPTSKNDKQTSLNKKEKDQAAKKTSSPSKIIQQKKLSKANLNSVEKKSMKLPERLMSEEEYQEEVEKIEKLIEDYPQTRDQLISIANLDDFFKSSQKEVRPHTIDETIQNQQGALKVLALKALITKEKDLQAIIRNLNQVIANAKDPTIVNISKAALEATKNGRPFFKDFSDAVESLPIPTDQGDHDH